MLLVILNKPDGGDYISMGRYPFVLRLATPGDSDEYAGWSARPLSGCGRARTPARGRTSGRTGQERSRRHHFTRSEGRDPEELGDYPPQTLFERHVDRRGSGYMKFFVANQLSKGITYHSTLRRRSIGEPSTIR